MKTLDPNRPTVKQRSAPRWASRAAKMVGLRPSTVEARVHGRCPAHEEVAAYITSMIESGNRAIAFKVVAPILAAWGGIPVPAFDADLVCRAAEADEEEAIARTRWQALRTPAALKAWRIAQETANGLAHPLYLATLAAERDV